MKFYQDWNGCINDGRDIWFPVSVPGNIQADYGNFAGYGDVNYGENFKKFKWLEEKSFIYQCEPKYSLSSGEKLFFVSKGIDYEFDIFLNGEHIFSQEGMFTPVEIDLTDLLSGKNIFSIHIKPIPKRSGAIGDTREEADHSVKPAVSYGWDWHPRLIPSGIWNETYFESRNSGYINECEAFYTLNEELTEATVNFKIKTDAAATLELFDPSGTSVYSGALQPVTLKNIQLWWCNGQGSPSLYTYRVFTGSDEKTGTIGLRKVELVMNEGAWQQPSDFPKTRSVAPATIKLNGRRIFAKGSNWVNPEIFTGIITRETYLPLIRLAAEANMNIFRCWGGAIVNKKEFFELCDEYGIMVWQEFPLACNNYPDDEHYLNILNREAISVVKALRRHPCIVLWCGGNELFNSWSGMTDQSLALRLLNKICYEYDKNTPFIMTSPLMGMAHGHYVFADIKEKKDVFQLFGSARNTAYSEFGVPSLSSYERLKEIIPENELTVPSPCTSWESHHAFNAWDSERWLCLDLVEYYFGKTDDVKKLTEYTNIMQCEGLKSIFEEGRRQKPYCSMTINWCYNEPWKTAANNSIIMYPAVPKPAYYHVSDALRPVLASARFEKFMYCGGELFTAELWLLNNSPDTVNDTISAYICFEETDEFLCSWNTGDVPANENKRGHKLQYILPCDYNGFFKIKLRSSLEFNSEYTLLIKNPNIKKQQNLLNM